jgi:hypothetical protein
MERAIHVRMTEENLDDLKLLAEKDRRRPSELVRFAVEDYLANRRLDLIQIREKKAAELDDKAALQILASVEQRDSFRTNLTAEVIEPEEPTL